jgi:CO/xanthine dehydrogenase FAD-binding subunit
MKAADFEYRCASSIAEACQLLAGAKGEGRLVAGGQTLVPLLAMRLARPALLIDINRITTLRGIELRDGAVAVKACTTQSDTLASKIIQEHFPLVAKALSHVGHVQTRNRGTIGGSLANADPVAEICMASLALDCEFIAQGPQSQRMLASEAFFQGAMTTALHPEECLTEIRFPLWQKPGHIGTSFQEVSIRRSDFALVAAAVQGLFDESGECRRIAIVVGGCSGAPLRCHAVADCLVGTRLGERALSEAMDLLQNSITPQSDLHASAEYRRRVVDALLRRAVLEAQHDACAGKS